MQHGEQKRLVDLSFSVPSECARKLEAGAIDIGLVPLAEIARQALDIVPGVGISCFGAVRSILLFSRVPWRRVRTLAADASSRTSVQLARVILAERFGVSPSVREHAPLIEQMLLEADAALIIGDPALRIDPASVHYEWLDLGEEWLHLTSLPMVFAAWAGKYPDPKLSDITQSSYQFGAENMDRVISSEYEGRGISQDLAREYLRHHIRFHLGPKELEGLRTFLSLSESVKRRDAYATTNG
jgi:predicted solute-binding protein